MKEVKGSSVAQTAYGKKLDTPITYDFTYNAYESGEELVNAKDELTLDEQVKVRNTERLSTARQKALQKALDDAGIVRPTIENDDQLRLKNMLAVLMSSKKFDEATARQIAADTLGLAWAE